MADNVDSAAEIIKNKQKNNETICVDSDRGLELHSNLFSMSLQKKVRCVFLPNHVIDLLTDRRHVHRTSIHIFRSVERRNSR